MYVALGAEQLLGAEKEGCRIGVEIKSFTGHSEMEELEMSVLVLFAVLFAPLGSCIEFGFYGIVN